MTERSLCSHGVRWHRAARAVAIAAIVALHGCFAMVAGVHQDMHFQSDLPDVNVRLDGQTCRVPCTLRIRRQWGTFNLQATQDDRVVAAGPIYRREEYEGDKCKDQVSGLTAAAAIDGLLIVPGIVDISTGIIVWHPEAIVIRQGSYLLDDQCFARPVVGGPK